CPRLKRSLSADVPLVFESPGGRRRDRCNRRMRCLWQRFYPRTWRRRRTSDCSPPHPSSPAADLSAPLSPAAPPSLSPPRPPLTSLLRHSPTDIGDPRRCPPRRS